MFDRVTMAVPLNGSAREGPRLAPVKLRV